MPASANEVVLAASGLGKTYAQPVLGEVSLSPVSYTHLTLPTTPYV